MMASGSGLAMLLKLYVMAPIWTPWNLESILAAACAAASGAAASASFPKSRLL
jgi:hypothetical protein